MGKWVQYTCHCDGKDSKCDFCGGTGIRLVYEEDENDSGGCLTEDLDFEHDKL